MTPSPELREAFITYWTKESTYLKQRYITPDTIDIILSFSAEREALAENRGIKKSIQIAKESKATFFVGPNYKPDEKVDKIVDEALYELRAEIVTNIECQLLTPSPNQPE